jgi:hypothetical protein
VLSHLVDVLLLRHTWLRIRTQLLFRIHCPV